MRYSKELHDKLRHTYKGNSHTLALLDEIERLQADRRWIPESGAPINRRVYVLMPNNYVVIATKFKSLCKDPNHYLWRNDSGAICIVTHWMPLPEPPEEK